LSGSERLHQQTESNPHLFLTSSGPSPHKTSVHQLLALQRAAGNEAVASLIEDTTAQRQDDAGAGLAGGPTTFILARDAPMQIALTMNNGQVLDGSAEIKRSGASP
jgi:hypothetical protein